RARSCRAAWGLPRGARWMNRVAPLQSIELVLAGCAAVRELATGDRATPARRAGEPRMDRRQQFRDLHRTQFVIPNPWDAGSARILASLGFPALGTTSGGFANSLGRLDGRVTREEAIEHARVIAAATPLPVSADLENGFGDGPETVADTV